MFASLTVVGLIFGLAWVQQIFLNHLIKADIEYLKSTRPYLDQDTSDQA